MKACAVSFKECWQEERGRWVSDGGFPLQMGALASLFDSFDLLIVGVPPRAGGTPLPSEARVVPMARPRGEDLRRKFSMLANLPYYLVLIAKYIRRADVIHVPLPGDIPLLAFFLGLALRKRVIARYGSSWADTSQTTSMNRFTKACIRRCAGGRVLAFATGAKEPPARVRRIFATALSQAEMDGIQPNLDREPSSPPRLVYIGRLSAEKGVANLVMALGRIKQEGFEPVPTLMIIGDGPQRQMLEALASRCGCGHLISFEGQLVRQDLSERLQHADLCVQPSLTEGFSKAWLDAMAHGVPVLATDVGGARDVIGNRGERGWLAAPGDVDSLAHELRRALTEPRDWRRLRRCCREYAALHTLEKWRTCIADACSLQWGMLVVDGKLRAVEGVSRWR